MARSSTSTSLSTLVFCSPFIATFMLVNAIVLHKLFPRVSGLHRSKDGEGYFLPSDAPVSLRQTHDERNTRIARRGIVAISFSTTIALAAVLSQLILCEISNTLHPASRSAAFRVTVPALLFFLIVLIPFLELQSVISGCGWSFRRTNAGRIPKFPWILQTVGFSTWIMVFWYLGNGVPSSYLHAAVPEEGNGLTEACLERVGIVGISIMAILSGFAAVSSSWQTFGVKSIPVTEGDVARKQAGLDATNEMLAAKKSRLRALQRKVHESPREGFMTKVIGSIRGGTTDGQEIKIIEQEISGLTSMSQSLSTGLSILQNRLEASRRAASPQGRFFFTPTSYAFALYCICRIVTAAFTALRRILTTTPDDMFSASTADPINRILSLLAKYVYPTLNQKAWSRQIAFFLSGIILLASVQSVIQTFHMLTKLSPSLLYQTQANLALIIAQILATYVISNALLLRSNLPIEMKSVVSEALGTPLEPGFVERWFEGWFLIAILATCFGIWIGQKFSMNWDDWEDGDIEMQKRS